MIRLNTDGRKWGASIRLKWNWRMSKPQNVKPAPDSRQVIRHDCRVSAWHKWRCFRGPMGEIDQAPRDDSGVMPRRIRRSIAKAVSKVAWKNVVDAKKQWGEPGKTING